MKSKTGRTWWARMRACRNPILLVRHFGFERQALDFVAGLTGTTPDQAWASLLEVMEDADFIEQLRERLARHTVYRPSAADFMLLDPGGTVFYYQALLYALVRLARPDRVVETGGTPGKSTAFMLRAMERNRHGHLWTLDLPPQPADQSQSITASQTHDLLPDGLSSNWLVPGALRERHTLLLGPSTETLPGLLQELDEIDVFIHDSDHSYDYMLWEYRAAWPAIRPGGLLLSDDIRGNAAWPEFMAEHKLPSLQVVNFGGVRRPT